MPLTHEVCLTCRAALACLTNTIAKQTVGNSMAKRADYYVFVGFFGQVHFRSKEVSLDLPRECPRIQMVPLRHDGKFTHRKAAWFI